MSPTPATATRHEKMAADNGFDRELRYAPLAAWFRTSSAVCFGEYAHGECHTQRIILKIYDEMAEAIRMGKTYQARLDPPLTDTRCAHPGSTRPVSGAWSKSAHAFERPQ